MGCRQKEKTYGVKEAVFDDRNIADRSAVRSKSRHGLKDISPHDAN
jgi:hypothetical protein